MADDLRYPANGPDAWLRAITHAFWRFVLWNVLIVGAIYITWRLRAVIISIFVAAILAYVMRPMAGWMARRPGFATFHNALAGVSIAMARPLRVVVATLLKRPRPVPVGGVVLPVHVLRVFSTLYVLILLFVGGYYALKVTTKPFVSEVTNVVNKWPTYKERFQGYANDATNLYNTKVDKKTRDWIEDQVRKGQGSTDLQRPLTAWTEELVRRGADLARNIVEIVLLPVLAFYFALDSKRIKKEFVSALPRRRWREVLRMIHEFNRIMVSFVVGQAILCAIAGVVVGVGLALLHVKYPLMLGILAGFTRAIPIIGPIIGGIPIIFFALVTRGVGVALGVLGFFTFLHFAESKFLMPYLIGDRMKLHPVVIIVVLLVGQEFGGLLGMFFAAPVAALLRVMVRRYWLRRHLGRRLSPPPLGPSAHVPAPPDRTAAEV